jgi:hypothetical protein
MLTINKLFFVTIFILAMAISGCSVGQSAEEKMYEHLEKTVSLEKGFSDVQKPLVEAEQKEQELFNEMLSLSMKEFDKIKNMADEASDLAKSRQELIKEEQESINTAYEEFKSVKDLAQGIEDKKVKSSADQLIKTMEERHKSYQNLNAAYTRALEMDIELYALFKKEDLPIEELKTFIGNLNQQYEEVLKRQDAFNQQTDNYNEVKKQFYQIAGLSSDKNNKS